MSPPTSKRVAFETARLSLARHKLTGDDSHTAASAHAAMVSAVALNVERVGIWMFDSDRQAIVSDVIYTRSEASFSRQRQRLEARTFPSYFRALKERRCIVAGDARTHAITRELKDAYLVPNGIGAILDAPVFVGGDVVGVVCHEHVGAPREFEQHEVDFASSVADMVALVEEQSARLALEIELRQQDGLRAQLAKLEAVGRLARAAAHDFNNVLSTAMMAVDPLVSHADKRVAEQAQLVIEATELGARIARELLVLGRDAPGVSVEVRIDELAQRLLPLLRSRYGSARRFTFEGRAKSCSVRADPAQLERVLLNLCSNAAEAIETEGTIEVLVREPDEHEAQGRGWLVLEVRDDGIGMSDHVQAHLFEPYFTTKPHGTGVGLASVYGVVRQLGGRITVDSELGEGTRFSVLLPAWV
ncbi:MAG TPA: ATP-binding protein [Polyangiales bacterium]|nr:ATP-binding protein [Polyangiales bacterium]